MMNANILNWYPFKEKSSVLYISIEEQKNIEQYLANVTNKLKIVSNITEISQNEKYDYIILLGTLEYAKEILKTENAEMELLNHTKQHLAEDGVMLIAANNRLGVKYLVGNRSKHCKHIYDSIENKYIEGKMFCKSELDKIIDNLNFKYRKNYYPLPDYQNVNILYSDEMLPEYNDSKINYNVVYEENSLILKDETTLLKQIIKEGNFKQYTNSYLIELSNVPIMHDIRYVSYNNMRKEEYSLILKIHKNMVEKYAKTKIAQTHIENIEKNNQKLKQLGFKLAEKELENNKIISKFIKMPVFDRYIVSKIKSGKISEAYELISTWYEYIKQKLKVNENGYIKDGFIDLVFENTFYNEKNNSFLFFDQEWYKENIPIDFILYRAIQNLYAHHKNLNEYLPIETIKEQFHIEEKEEFQKLENELQEQVIDEQKKEFYAEQYKYMISSEEIIKMIEDIKRLDKDNIALIEEIDRIKNMTIFNVIKNKMKKGEF